MTDSWTRIRHLFRAANELDPSEWVQYLATACPDDAGVRDRVLQLLREQDRDEAFLESPAVAEAATENDDLPEGRRIGPYEVVRVIARGGMGVVYEARDVRLDKVVALKTMTPQLARNPTVRQRFEQEARTLARLEDPHVVRIHALQDEGPDTFIVMEYVQGPTLAEYLRRRGRLSPKEALFLTRQLLTALSKAHRLAIVHRDLKPANVMLARDDEGRPLVKVLDFGIAKQLGGAAQTMTHGAIGTLLYMAPEQVRGARDIDGRADLYALGVMLYEMLAGELPYDRRSDEYSLRRQIVEGPIEPLYPRLLEIPVALSAVVERAMAKGPDDRFATAEEMLRAIQALDQPRREPPPPPLQPPLPPPPSSQKPLLWGAIGAIGAIGGLIYVLNRPPALSDIPASSLLAADSTQLPTPESPLETLSNIPGSRSDGAVAISLPDPSSVSTDSQTDDRGIEPPATHPVTELDPTTPGIDLAGTPDTSASVADTTGAPVSIAPRSLLRLAFSPSGDLFLDDTPTASGAAMEDVAVEAGDYTARVVNAAYGEWRCAITLSPDTPLPLAVDFLTPVFVIVAAEDADTGRPLANAAITIDGVNTPDTTPQTLRLPPGVRRIEASLPGYRQVDIQPESPAGCYQRLGRDTVNLDRYAFGERARVVVHLKKEG
ncbi:MAG: serine/threonine-protein kinase [Rhodothermales bacterium]|nr:serine/threonine-protein kinase [Rhodothermales bacterium]